jgi:hypothetical protein
VTPYISARQALMNALPDPAWAIVSLSSYATVADARRVVAPAEVGGLLVAAAGGFPQTIGASDSAVAGWVSATRSRAQSDAAGVRSMLPTAGDPQTVADFQADLSRLAIVARVKASDPIVFGLVVRGPAAALRTLATSPAVRLVDPVGATEPDVSSAAGLRPEEQVTTGTPSTRPMS